MRGLRAWWREVRGRCLVCGMPFDECPWHRRRARRVDAGRQQRIGDLVAVGAQPLSHVAGPYVRNLQPKGALMGDDTEAPQDDSGTETQVKTPGGTEVTEKPADADDHAQAGRDDGGDAGSQ